MSFPDDEECWATPRSPVNCATLSPAAVTNVIHDHNTAACSREDGEQIIRRKIKRLQHPTDTASLFRATCCLGNFLLSAVLSTLFLSLAVVLVPVCFIIRKLARFLVKYCRHRQESSIIEMSLSDRFWFPDFPSVNTAAVSTIFLVFEGQLSVDEVTDLIKERWLPRCAVKSQEIFPKLTREAVKVTADFYGWKEYEQFKLDDHVVEMDGKVTLDLAALNDFNLDTSEEISRGQRQLWRVSVLPKYSKTHDTGILLRMHASMADHLSFMRFTLESLHYKTVYLREDCFPFRRLCLCLCAVVAGPLLILQRLLMKRDTSLSTIPSPENDSPGFLSFLWSEAVDLKAANRIKDITRTKVEVVLISCLAGAVRSYLQKCGLPSPRDVRICMEVDMRPRHSQLKLDSQLSFVFVKLPVGTEGAVPRLWETRRRLGTFRCTLERFVTWGFVKLCLLLFPVRIVQRIINFLMSKVSCNLVYLGGPDVPLYFNGKMAKLMTLWVPRMSESGMAFSLVSHGNHVRLGLVAYHPLPCDPKFLVRNFEREVQLLAKHLENRTTPSQRWRSRQARQARSKEDTEEENLDEAV